MQEIYSIGETYVFHLAQLVRSQAYNVRTKQERTSAKYQAGIEALGALILAEGLLQNLVGFQQKKGKKFLNVIEIVAGGRRLDAIAWLASTGKIDPETFQIEVRICSIEQARTRSLAENSHREDLAPADQFRAFKALADEGKTVEEIAVAWGVDPILIRRRLKLANVAPRLFALYEEGAATLDQLMALALTDDHAAQEQIWDSTPPYNRTAHHIRNLITAQEIDVRNNKVARFVGIKAYEQAGGEVRRDLFSENGGGFMKDAALLESLAVAKLESMTPELKEGGWAWIDYCTNINWDELDKFAKVKMVNLPFSTEDQQKYDAMQARDGEIDTALAALQESAEAEDAEEAEEAEAVESQIEALEAEQRKLQEAAAELAAAYRKPDPAYQKVAGVIVTIDHDATIRIHKGLVRPEDKKEIDHAAAIERGHPVDDHEAAEKPKTKAVHSERLTRQLTAHRTAALRVLVAERPDVGLVILAHKLALDVFKFGRHYRTTPSAAQVTLQHTYIESEGEDVAASLAFTKFAEKRQAWEERMPANPDDLFAWLLEQDPAVVLELMTFCTAYSLTTVQGVEEVNIAANQIAKAVQLDMADWWTPTRDSYFGQVPKQHIITVVSDAISPEVAKPLAEMKKIPLAETAEKEMRDRRWLPPILKVA